MATIIRTVHWTFQPGAGDPVALVTDAVRATDFAIESASPSSIVVDVPRALLKNRWAAKITGALTPAADGSTNVEWTIDGPGSKHYEHMVTIAQGLPDETLDDHGIPEAVSKIAAKVFGRKEIRHLANVLDVGEHVHVIGIGSLDGKLGIIALTDRRLVFLEKSIGSEHLVEFDLGSIGAMSLDKKRSGETLKISHSGTEATITDLQHGQGDAVARRFRELRAQREQPTAVPAAALSGDDLLTQIERLADLRERGILTEEEFQTRKAHLLSTM